MGEGIFYIEGTDRLWSVITGCIPYESERYLGMMELARLDVLGPWSPPNGLETSPSSSFGQKYQSTPRRLGC